MNTPTDREALAKAIQNVRERNGAMPYEAMNKFSREVLHEEVDAILALLSTPAQGSREQMLIDLVHQYRSDLIRPPAPDSKERRIQLIDATLSKLGAGK